MNSVPSDPFLCEMPLARLRFLPGHAAGFHFDERDADDDALVASVREFGFFCHVLASAVQDGSVLVMDGYRRIACAEALGLDTVPCTVVGELSEQEVLLRRLVANTVAGRWTKSEVCYYLTGLGLTAAEQRTAAKLSGPEQVEYLRSLDLTRRPTRRSTH